MPHSSKSHDALNDAAAFTCGIPGFRFQDLFAPERLAELLRRFMDDLEHRDPSLGLRYRELLEAGNPTRDEETWIAMNIGPHVSRFLGVLFGVTKDQEKVLGGTRALDVIFRVRKDFLKRRVQKMGKPASDEHFDFHAAEQKLQVLVQALGAGEPGEHAEVPFCRTISKLLDLQADLASVRTHGEDPSRLCEQSRGVLISLLTLRPDLGSSPEVPKIEALAEDYLDVAARWMFVEQTRSAPDTAHLWVVFRKQHTMDFQNLVGRKNPRPDLPELWQGPEASFRRRNGFKLTDPRMDIREALGEVDICIFCHEQGRDTCSKGHLEKSGAIKKNPLGIPLEGCPLDEHISEAHLLRQRGDIVGALAAVMINNPMCPGTGHRICNDCMKACIYQKQDPVNIPQIETSILTSVLRLPYGPEMYGLLTRWNPLNVRRPYQRPLNGKKILVVGLGPAGYTLAHYLTSEGFGVVAIDGLKLEPLPAGLAPGKDMSPLQSWDAFVEPLDQRILEGFGGVSEYGITVRWDKNFLRLLYVTLSRKQGFSAFGGVRLGGTLTLEDAAELGFDHVAIATGAGKPTIVPMKNNLIRGVRQASDFLMALQLTGACKEDSLANLQVSLPAVVIGGGLTAIDTATELAAYYPLMVERVLARSEMLEVEGRLGVFLARLAPDERATYDTYLAHGRIVREERLRAAKDGRIPDLLGLVRSFGGVTIAYRKTLQDSPAYRLNHEEVIKALEEGIYFLENVSPIEAVPDASGKIVELVLEGPGKKRIELPCQSLLVAAGTSPNTIYAREYPDAMELDGKFFKAFEAGTDHGQITLKAGTDKSKAFFTSYRQGGLTVSYYGDNHPAYAGNVVKAMASARNGFPKVVEIFQASLQNQDPSTQHVRDRSYADLVSKLDEALVPRVVKVVRLTPTITEVVLHAPMQAKKFEPGQFYRLQDFESEARKIRGIRLSMEGLALTGAWVDREKGLLSLIVLEMGGSSNLCALLSPGQRVVCMGPTGAPTEIPSNENVVLCGGGLGNAVLFSIAKALKAAGSRVLYFAGYKNGEDLFKREEIESATDQVIFSSDAGEMIEPRRPMDRHFRGNIVQAMIAYARGDFGAQVFPFRSATRIIAIGSDRMMAAVKMARHDPELLATHVGDHIAVGSINSPMQCMMKEVCAQCLQRHVDPKTGEESFVFSCFNQDQELDHVDFQHLNLRLRQNGVLEKLSAATISLLLSTYDGPRV